MRLELLLDFLEVRDVAVRDRQQADLHRCEPQRERAGKVLGDDADEALDRAEHDAVDHDRAVALAVRADVFEVKALGHLHVELDRAALPGTAERVGQMEVELRAVERAVALVDGVILAHIGDGVLERFGREVPGLLLADVVLRHCGNLDLILQAEDGVDLVEQLDDVLDLVLHLVPGHEDVRVVLREAAHAEQAVQCARKLVAVHEAQLADAHRQVAVRVRLRLVHQHAARAVHRLDRVVFAVDDGRVHVVLIVVPVAGAVPQRLIQDDRRGDLHIAVALVDLAPVVDQRVAQHHALRQEEREARALLREHEQAEVAAELAVVALLRLLEHREVLVERALLRERNAVDALEHLVLRVAAPVGAGDRRELHGLDRAGAQQVRAGAEVGKVALRVEGDLLASLGVLRDQLLLVRLAGHLLLGLRRGQLEALERDVLLLFFFFVLLLFSFLFLFFSASIFSRSSPAIGVSKSKS